MSRSQLERGSVRGFGSDDTGCTVLHVDMDAFYASVSLLRHPELAGRPVIVGGAGNRGVVLSATYEARALGVHSAMPMSRARRIAPDAVVLQPDFAAYERASASVMRVFAAVTEQVEPLSADEAFLDVAPALRRLGRPTAIADGIRAAVYDEQGITCSIGIAPNKFVAKMASARAKPDGVLLVPVDRVLDFLHPMPVSALWGVGERTEARLRQLGLRTVADVAATPRRTLLRALGPALGAQLHDLSWGRDDRPVASRGAERSIGADETFATDVDDPDVVRTELLRLSDKVARRMRRAGLAGRTVGLRVRFADFTTISRARTLRDPTDVAREIFRTALDLYEGLGLQRVRLRLVGVRVERLVPADTAPRQLLLDEAEHGWRDAEQAVDRLRDRFGPRAVGPARLLAGRGPGPRREGYYDEG